MDLVVQADIQANEFVLSVHPFAPIFKGALYLNLHHNGNYGPNNLGQYHQSYCGSG